MPSISQWSDMPKDSIGWALASLQDAHFKTFNAMEAQTAKRARARYADGLRKLQSAFDYLHLQLDLPIYSKASELDADEYDADFARLRKLAYRLNPNQFMQVDVDTMRKLLAMGSEHS